MGQVEIGYAEHCFHGVPPCGDGLITAHHQGITRMMLVDGIGHGLHANGILVLLQQQFRWICERSKPWAGIDKCLLELHLLLLKEQKGYQAAVAMLDVNANTWQISALCVGNIKVHQVSSGLVLSVPCLNGMVGGQLPQRLPLSGLRWDADSFLALHSDGIRTRELLPYLQTVVGFSSRTDLEAQTIADTIIDRFSTNNDDASCVVLLQR